MDCFCRFVGGEIEFDARLASNDRTQAEDVTDLQLHVYALGYQQAVRENAANVVVTNLDELGSDRTLPVTAESLDDALKAVRRVAELLRSFQKTRSVKP